MLLLHSLKHDFNTPVFLTYAQGAKMGVYPKGKGNSFPVYHISYMYYNPQDKDRISIEKYEGLSEVEQKNYYLIPIPKCYDVFNLDYTNYNEIYPEEWAAMLEEHTVLPYREEEIT